MDAEFLLGVKREFRERGGELLIAYDVDDILWSLMSVVSRYLSIDLERCLATFGIHDNTLLTPQEQDAVIAAFSNADLFREMKFYSEAIDILRPMELGAKVIINSNSYNDEIADLKREQLLAIIPNLRKEQLCMNIVGEGKDVKHKKFNPDTVIVVDDSPFNVAMSPALVGVMSKWIPWSCSPEAKQAVRGKRVVWKNNLAEINDFVYDLTKQLVS